MTVSGVAAPLANHPAIKGGPPRRLVAMGAFVGGAVVLIAILTFLLPYNSKPALFLLDYGRGSIFDDTYPVTIQNALHILTAVGLGDLFVRWRRARFERAHLAMGLLPEDDETVLAANDLGAIRRRVVPLAKSGAAAAVLIDAATLQAMTSRSLEQVSTIVNAKLELLGNRLDLEYQTIRYIAWLIPTIGFVGTVVGIAVALEGIDDPQNLHLEKITAGLGIAFYTTILALLESAVVVFIQNNVQKYEELSLNAAADYVLTNLINRLYLPK